MGITVGGTAVFFGKESRMRTKLKMTTIVACLVATGSVCAEPENPLVKTDAASQGWSREGRLAQNRNSIEIEVRGACDIGWDSAPSPQGSTWESAYRMKLSGCPAFLFGPERYIEDVNAQVRTPFPRVGMLGLSMRAGERVDMQRWAVLGAERGRARFFDLTAAYRVPSRSGGAVFGSMGLMAEPSRAFYTSGYRDETPEGPNESGHRSRFLAIGYAWRDMRVEGAAYSERTEPVRSAASTETFRLTSKSARLSFSPSQKWAFQLGRGSIDGLDRVLPDGGVRRTVMSATYKGNVSKGAWQTTLAWGRNSRRGHQAMVGYLLESTFQIGASHLAFGRLEEVGSDELLRIDDSLPRQLFKLNKFTIGYFHRIDTRNSGDTGIGIVASRHFVPNRMNYLYGENSTSVRLFMRLAFE
jgi:hypothetical protein